MYLGIEIGGTKLQFGVGEGEGSAFLASQRLDIDPTQGAEGILAQIQANAGPLISQHAVQRIGIGFGGPVNTATGKVTTSHQVDGWDNFAFSDWCRATFGIPATLGNDCNVATIAESRFGAGRGARRVFYLTVGTGIGGGFAIDGQLDGAERPAIAEIGHLRPGLHAENPDATVESLASGWGIVAHVRSRISDDISRSLATVRDDAQPFDPSRMRQRVADAQQAEAEFAADLLVRCEEQIDQLTGKIIGEAAVAGNQIAQEALTHACEAIGWAVAQVVTLMAPEVLVIGGGVSLLDKQLFLSPVQKAAAKFVFPPLREAFEIKPPSLGEWVVVHGALAFARDADK
ncbi:MAG: ROK family protein [Pirellulaceae bacterium]|nr:ROK family protein [Pirellulaceae bacterium]